MNRVATVTVVAGGLFLGKLAKEIRDFIVHDNHSFQRYQVRKYIQRVYKKRAEMSDLPLTELVAALAPSGAAYGPSKVPFSRLTGSNRAKMRPGGWQDA